MKKFYFLFFLLTSFTLSGQDFSVSENSEISILTIGPGSQLYDSFGHSAFRIKDTTKGFDIIFNYGVYDFNTPNFYTKFAQGKLLYQLDTAYFKPFYESYVRQKRWVKEQILELSYSEKKALSDFLWNNAQPENKKYLYDFFFDNCATKIRDVLVEVMDGKLTYREDHITEAYTFRELIQQNVQANSWGSLGMDTAIGAVVDRPATPWEYQFLPKYVFEGAANATIHNNGSQRPLVKKTNILFMPKEEIKKSSNFITSPLFVFGLLALILLLITYQDFKKKKRSRYLDGLIFVVTGVIGVFILLLWFGTDHSTTANNYNLLWAFPLSLFFSYGISKRAPKKWLRRYVFFLMLAMLLLDIHWMSGVQAFAIGLLPLFLALFVRYVYVAMYLKNMEKH